METKYEEAYAPTGSVSMLSLLAVEASNVRRLYAFAASKSNAICAGIYE